MSKLGAFMVSEKTRVTISIATFCVVIGAIGLGAWTVSDFKTTLELRMESLEYKEACSEEDIAVLLHEQQGIKTNLADNQADFAEIKTDLKWIRAALSE